MKNIVFIITFILLLKPVMPVIDYAINYEYISKVLCENKAKPKMKCNGKCHLMKELAKAAENEKPISSDKKITAQESEVLFFEDIKPFNTLHFYSADTEKLNSRYSNLYSYLDSISPFHPPAVIS